MPLQPAYAWSETETGISITIDNVPVKDAGQLFCSDRVVKLNCPPYLLLLDLKHAVDDDRSTAVITKGRKVAIHLTKAQPGPWTKLTADGDAASIKKQREESVQRAHDKVLAAQQQRQARKQQEERAAVDHQIKQQKAQRDQLEALKEQELQQERQELQQWQQQLPHHAPQQQQLCATEGDESDYEDDTAADAAAEIVPSTDQEPASKHDGEYHGRGWWPQKAATGDSSAPDDAGISSTNTLDCRHVSPSNNSGSDSGRNGYGSSSDTGGICTDHTCSSVTCAEPAAATCLMLDADSTADTQEPFISVSSSRKLHEPSAAAPCTASSTHLAADGSSSSLPSRPVAPVRSKAAPVQVNFTQLETPHLPAREQRELEIKQIKRSAGRQADSMDVADRQPAFLKDKGDALAAQGNFRGAINAYSKALELDPQQAALWANRAAAHLALGHAAECVQDCDAAIRLVHQAVAALQHAPGAAAERELQAGMLGAAAQPAVSDVQEPGPGPAHCCGAEAPGSIADHLQATAAAATAAADGEAVGSSGLTSAAAEAEGEATTAATATATEAAYYADAGIPECRFSSSSVLLPADVSNTPDSRASDSTDSADHSSSDAASALPASADVSIAEAEQRQQQQQQHFLQDHSNMAAKLKHLLVKLFARRAAAYVDLQQLQQAQEDLQQALRLDPDNMAVRADALELSLALQPSSSTDPAAIKELAAARFKAGDKQGAAEAYTSLIEQLLARGPPPQQRQQQQQGADSQPEQPRQQQEQQLGGALSNRAACWLSLNKYAECVRDCWMGLAALLPADAMMQGHADSDAAGHSSCNNAGTAVLPASGVPPRSMRGSHSHSSALSEWGSDVSEGEAAKRLEQYCPEQLVQLTSKAAARTAALLVGRMAAAYSCLRAVEAADAAYSWAAACWQLLGEGGRVASIRSDQERWWQQHDSHGSK